MASIAISNLSLDSEKQLSISELELTTDELMKIRGGTVVAKDLPDGSTVFKVYNDNTHELVGKYYDKDRNGTLDGKSPGSP